MGISAQRTKFTVRFTMVIFLFFCLSVVYVDILFWDKLSQSQVGMWFLIFGAIRKHLYSQNIILINHSNYNNYNECLVRPKLTLTFTLKGQNVVKLNRNKLSFKMSLMPLYCFLQNY